MIAYCLFCRTNRCGAIAAQLELRGEVTRAFSPQIIRRQRKQGVNEEKSYDLLPGYVFVFTREALSDFRAFSGIDGVVRRIGDAEDGWRLVGGDYDFAMNLLQKDGRVGQITLFQEGDTVRLTDPLFNGCSGTVERIDHRKQRAKVVYRFAGMDCFTWIACEMIKKAEDKTETK